MVLANPMHAECEPQTPDPQTHLLIHVDLVLVYISMPCTLTR
jgi:hypothetical protein